MSGFTRFGSGIWDWAPFTDLDFAARNLWLAIYTSAEAKRLPAGLWHGGIPTMAEASRMRGEEVANALEVMIERDLIAYDKQRRVIRLCGLPDGGERPANGKVIYGWWSRFNTVPACNVRDAHVRTLRWLLEQGKVTPDHENAWGSTFATIKIPVTRARVRPNVQGDLFPSREPSDTVSDNGIHMTQLPRVDSHPPPSARSNDVANLDTVCETVWLPDPDPVSSFTADRGLREPNGDLDLRAIPEHGEPPVDLDQRPRLALVPLPEGPFTVDELVAAFGRSHLPLPPELRERLASAIREVGPRGVWKADIELLSNAVKAGELPEVTVFGRRYVGWERVIAMADARTLMDAITQARARRARVDDQRKILAEARQKAGV